MAKISASEMERVISALPNPRVLGFRDRVRPHNSEIPVNANSRYLNPPTLVVLDTPNDVYARPRTILLASHIQPGNSTAQIDYGNNEGDGPLVSGGFHFWWENSNPNPVLLEKITSRLTINGSWVAAANCHSALLSLHGTVG